MDFTNLALENVPMQARRHASVWASIAFLAVSGLAAAQTTEQKLTANDGAAGDDFGVSPAIHGNTIVIGAPLDEVNGNRGQGSARVFMQHAGNWTEEQRLTAGDGAAFDVFGTAVAMSGDTLVIGVPGDQVNGNAVQGSARVFVNSGGVWTEQQTLTASDGAGSDGFGGSIAISGGTLVIGAPSDDVDGNDIQGSAYVFVLSGGSWVERQKLTAANGAPHDFFGASVAIQGDTIVVGAPTSGQGQPSPGSAHVFVESNGVWTEQQELMASDSSPSDSFGNPVVLDGDTLVAGARTQDGARGAAYVFEGDDGVWTERQKLTASDGVSPDLFGASIALDGETMGIGAFGDDLGAGFGQGSVYIFVSTDDDWVETQKLTASDGAAGDFFGSDVALQGGKVVAGSPFDDVGANTNQGSAYVFSIEDEELE